MWPPFQVRRHQLLSTCSIRLSRFHHNVARKLAGIIDSTNVLLDFDQVEFQGNRALTAANFVSFPAASFSNCPAGEAAIPRTAFDGDLSMATCPDRCKEGYHGTRSDHTELECDGECLAGCSCPVGSTSECQVPCEPGTNATPASATCEPCPQGHFQDLAMRSSCKECPVGKTQSEPGQQSCDPCGRGSFANRHAQSSCTQCPPGTHGEARGSVACNLCPAGKFSEFLGSKTCELCPMDMHSPSNSTTCYDCVLGADCTDGVYHGAMQHHWSNTITDAGMQGMADVQYHLCTELVGQSSDRCEGGHSSKCREGHTGALCSNCLEGWVADLDGRCTSCDDSGSLAGQYTVFGVALAAVVAISIKVWYRLRASWKNRMVTIAKVMIPFFQILSVARRAFSFRWPPTFKMALGLLSGLALDFDLSPMECAFNLDHYGHLVLTTLLPVAITLMGVAALKARSACLQKVGTQATGNLRPVATFVCGLPLFLYAPICKRITETFNCYPVGDESYLLADMRLQCYTAEHFGWMVYAGVATLVYPLGVPGAFLWLLRRDRKAQRPPLAILTESYEPEFWYFEIVEVCTTRPL